MFNLNRGKKIIIIISVDTILITLSCIVAFLLINPFLAIKESNEVYYIGLNILLYIVYGCLFNVFNHINRYTDLTEMISILMSTTLMSLTSVLLILMIHVDFSKRVFFLVYIFSTFFIILSRLSWRLLIEKKIRHTTSKNIETNRIIVIGAGAGGRILLNAFDSEKNNGRISLIGFVDDNPNKKNMYLSKVKVLGRVEDLPKLIKGNNVNMVTIAIPSLSKKRLREIVTLLEKSKVRVTTMPSLEEIVAGNITVEKLKQVEINDLLGRDEVKLDIDSIRDQITNKVILVTGAGGSIGSEICRQLVKFEPQRLILLGHGENSIYSIHRELSNKFKNYSCEIIPVIADVQDRKRIFEIVAQYHPNLVYHAAAHKHVPLMEYNPREAVKNNIYGTKNVAEASKKYNVDHFVMVSTDKANNPPNVMGATKRIAEMIVTSLNEADCTKFSAVRFGNVLGSRGSVIPLFKEQIANGGPVTVTDFRMTRFFMTIPEASRLVIQSGSLAKGGEIFILDMGEPVQILELAKNRYCQ
ncbi:TPA: polysaccharide biosynthesis protein [Streptococcus suis]